MRGCFWRGGEGGYLYDELVLADGRAIVHGFVLVAIAARVHLVLILDLLACCHLCRGPHLLGSLSSHRCCLLSVHCLQDRIILYLELLQGGGHCGCLGV